MAVVTVNGPAFGPSVGQPSEPTLSFLQTTTDFTTDYRLYRLAEYTVTQTRQHWWRPSELEAYPLNT